MKTVEEIKAAIEASIPGAAVEIGLNPSVSGQHSLRLAPSCAFEVAKFLRDDPELALDYLSNVTGIDWPDKEITEKVNVTRQSIKTIDGVETPVEETVEETRKRLEPGCLEAVYHLYSVEKKHGPVILRMRTIDRTEHVDLPSLTPIWRSAEFQEREIFDLYGIVFTGHPDLRRLLMWAAFKYEPTAHDDVLKRSQEHQAAIAQPKAEAGR
jgi:NADH-quinone oxidoreductase subunit C